MGYIHFFRSGGVNKAGKTVLASMLMEYLQMHQIPAYYIDSQENPTTGLHYSPEQNTGQSRIYFDLRDITRADPIIELSINAEVIVDLPAHAEDIANVWIQDLVRLIEREKVKVFEWFIFTYSTTAWEAHTRQVAFWKDQGVHVQQIFFLPEHLPRTPCVPHDFKEICMKNKIPYVVLPAPEGMKLDDRLIHEIIDTAKYPHNISLQDWQQKMFVFFQRTRLFKDQERLAPEYKPEMHPLEMLQVAKAHMFQNNLQPKKLPEPEQKVETENDFPW